LYNRNRFIVRGLPKGSIKVDVDTIDNILKELKISKIDFLKMDIEGAEIEALKGAKETLKNKNIKLVIAAYHEIDRRPTYKTIISNLEKMGFRIHREDGILYCDKDN
jgi:3-dehydroquinate dehydratase